MNNTNISTHRKWRLSPVGVKNTAISHWGNRGVNGDLDKLYEIYLESTYCWCCGVDFDAKHKKCLDHCHSSGDFRQILCHKCNMFDRWLNYYE